ncbi:hypothetical protein ANO14919_039080 [Xylariales sp. No.14919]|nr:hypothetical protein ANO14919_039080 [Xylariales sp. No.14919]
MPVYQKSRPITRRPEAVVSGYEQLVLVESAGTGDGAKARVRRQECDVFLPTLLKPAGHVWSIRGKTSMSFTHTHTVSQGPGDEGKKSLVKHR